MFALSHKERPTLTLGADGGMYAACEADGLLLSFVRAGAARGFAVRPAILPRGSEVSLGRICSPRETVAPLANKAPLSELFGQWRTFTLSVDT